MNTLKPQNREFYIPDNLETARRVAADLERQHPSETATRDELLGQYLSALRAVADTFTPEHSESIYDVHTQRLPLSLTNVVMVNDATPEQLRVAAIACVCWAVIRLNPENITSLRCWVEAAERIVYETYRTRKTDRTITGISGR